MTTAALLRPARVKITEAYRAEQALQHADPSYGQQSVQFAPIVSQIIERMQITAMLDYGCGKARLMEHLSVKHPMQIQCYDPAVERFAGDPFPMQMCVAIDVLEHVEPDCVDVVMDDLKRVTGQVGFFTVSTVEAGRALSDGRNAHVSVHPMEWWLPKFLERFELQTLQRTPTGFYVIVFAREQLIERPENDDFDTG